MSWLKRHWLGVAVLVSCIVYGAQMPPRFDTKMVVSAGVFLFLLAVWMLRGFVRFLGRAWHHGARTATRDAR